MMTEYPKRIKFPTDGNEAVLQRTEFTQNGKKKVGMYKYVVSKTKNGLIYPFSLEQIEDYKRKGVIEIMEP